MKKLVVLGMGLCMALAFTSCKSSESAYKKAYEKAKQQEMAEAPVAEEAPVAAEVKPAGKSISLGERLKPLMRVAAVVAILSGTSYLAVQPIIEQAKNEQMMMAEIEFTEDDYQYLLDEYEAEDMYYILTDNK